LPHDVIQRANQRLDLWTVSVRFQSQHNPVAACSVYTHETIPPAGQFDVAGAHAGGGKGVFIGPDGSKIPQVVEASDLY
jgi:hypothetical protein